ncbi:hypothetical protein [Cytobacillus luteolus]|uniref:hypothetical protein n=1 Tax=Litchfieldia luteola TaxID=682179 RepID=UPI001CB40221|nr:hypothetical protein [Cytobacillus luteolus]MBP1940384.1 hypothetical protein [Cytobacillus luteolus]
MKSKYLVIPFIISLFVALSACSHTSPEFEIYEGKSLSIAVIGTSPLVKESQVKFNEISFDELLNNNLMSYDAVLIMKEHLNQASESQYADVYLNSGIPFFFLSAKAHIPFTSKDEKYSDFWGWSSGENYAAGVLISEEGDTLKSWGFGLYNDEKKEAHIQEMYSRIFKTVENSYNDKHKK